MRDQADSVDAPLATRVCLVRQLASPHGRSRVSTVNDNHVLVVGDTQSGLPELPAALQEGRKVAQLFRDKGHRVNLLERPDGQQVMVNLFDERYRVIHLAAHGSVAEGGKGYTGMVLGPNTYLTTAQVNKLRHVPELVFINCCHLGSMKAEERPRWGELAANLATQFIEMGCKAVVAAGWAVDDAAADTFASAFYGAMLDGTSFGVAVRTARYETWRLHPASNTWGAYQAYGDELYSLIDDQGDDWQAPDYLHVSQVISELERIRARMGPANDDEKALYGGRLEKIETAIRARFFHLAEVRECLGAVWADLDEKGRAIEHYRAALQADGSMCLPAVEQLANIEIRLGEERAQQPGTALDGRELMKTGLQRLQALLAIVKTVERLSLLGSHWKRCTLLTAEDINPENINDALRLMNEVYTEASELSLKRDGDRDYYPTLNALDGAIVLAARGDAKAYRALKTNHVAWLADAKRNGSRRYAAEREFFHAYAEVEAARVDALWAMLDERSGAGLGDKDIRKKLVAAHHDLRNRMGNPRKHDSVMKQLQWLIALLPEKGGHKNLRAAVQQLRTEIESA